MTTEQSLIHHLPISGLPRSVLCNLYGRAVANFTEEELSHETLGDAMPRDMLQVLFIQALYLLLSANDQLSEERNYLGFLIDAIVADIKGRLEFLRKQTPLIGKIGADEFFEANKVVDLETYIYLRRRLEFLNEIKRTLRTGKIDVSTAEILMQRFIKQ
jgi:hypothetical protein